MIFADLELSRRLERAEAHAGLEFAKARARLDSADCLQSSAAWMEHSGTIAVFDGPESPITQTFCLGLFEELTSASLEVVEGFFLDRGAPAIHEVSPYAGTSTTDLLCASGYRPVEYSSVMYQPVNVAVERDAGGISVRLASPGEALLWADLSAKGWAADYPAMEEIIRQFGHCGFARANAINFVAEADGQPAATASLCLYQDVALFGGASTIPEFRRRGLQSALLSHRMNHAIKAGFKIAMMVAAVGSQSQRNAERNGFRIAYTRTKWQKSRQDSA